MPIGAKRQLFAKLGHVSDTTLVQEIERLLRLRRLLSLAAETDKSSRSSQPPELLNKADRRCAAKGDKAADQCQNKDSLLHVSRELRREWNRLTVAPCEAVRTQVATVSC